MDHASENKYGGAYRRDRPRHDPYDEFSLRHPRMDLGQRAKIFSPFAALKGFEQAIEEKLELYEEKRELNEEEQERLERALALLRERTRSLRLVRADPVTVSVTYYVPCRDENHEAYGLRGRYETLTGVVRKGDPERTGTLRIDETEIDLADLADIRIEESDKEEA